MNEPLNIRLVLLVSASELDAVEAYWHDQRMSSRSEAARQLIQAGLVAVGAKEAAEPAADLPAPTLPAITGDMRAFLADMVFPWMRQQGRREYGVDEVLDGAFPADKGNQPIGRDKAIIKLFQIIGWKLTTTRKGGITRRLLVAPTEA